MDLPLLNFKKKCQKKVGDLLTTNFQRKWAFLSLVYSSCKKYVSVVQGLYKFQLLLCRTEIWFVHILYIRAESYVVLLSQGNAVGSRSCPRCLISYGGSWALLIGFAGRKCTSVCRWRLVRKLGIGIVAVLCVRITTELNFEE